MPATCVVQGRPACPLPVAGSALFCPIACFPPNPSLHPLLPLLLLRRSEDDSLTRVLVPLSNLLTWVSPATERQCFYVLLLVNCCATSTFLLAGAPPAAAATAAPLALLPLLLPLLLPVLPPLLPPLLLPLLPRSAALLPLLPPRALCGGITTHNVFR